MGTHSAPPKSSMDAPFLPGASLLQRTCTRGLRPSPGAHPATDQKAGKMAERAEFAQHHSATFYQDRIYGATQISTFDCDSFIPLWGVLLPRDTMRPVGFGDSDTLKVILARAPCTLRQRTHVPASPPRLSAGRCIPPLAKATGPSAACKWHLRVPRQPWRERSSSPW